MKVFVESGAAGLKSIEHQLVTILEIRPVELKFFDSGFARMAVPAIRQDYSAVVPKQSFDFRRHNAPSLYSVIPRKPRKGFHYRRTGALAEAKFSVQAFARAKRPGL
jgi:hypothetical protein